MTWVAWSVTDTARAVPQRDLHDVQQNCNESGKARPSSLSPATEAIKVLDVFHIQLSLQKMLNKILLLAVSFASIAFLVASNEARSLDGRGLLPGLADSLGGDSVAGMAASIPDEVDELRSEAFNQTAKLRERFDTAIGWANVNSSISLLVSVALSLIETIRVCFLPWLNSILLKRGAEDSKGEKNQERSSVGAWLLWGSAIFAILFSCVASQATNEAFCLKQREAEIVEEYVVLEQSTAGHRDGHPAVVEAASDFRKRMLSPVPCKRAGK